MNRVVGFFLKLDGTTLYQRYITKGGAIDDAKQYLTLGKAKKIGVVRANDNILVMTIAVNKKKEFITNIK